MAFSFRPLVLALLVLSAACSSTPEQRIAVPSTPAEVKQQRIAFGTVQLREVSLPSYAAGEEIFVADATGLLSARPGLFWADDPARAITLELARHLGRVTGARVVSEPWPFDTPAEAEVELRVEEMVARATGGFRLAGQYFVTSESGRARARLFAIKVPLPPSEDAETGIDATALAQARGQAVRDLAVEIARNGLR